MGDVYTDRRPLRVDEIVRTVNHETAERRIREQDESRAAASGMNPQGRQEGGLSQDQSEGYPSYYASVGRDRLLSRFGHSRERVEPDHLMEQGQYRHEAYPVTRSRSHPSRLS